MFDDLLSRMPNDEADFKIGALPIWVTGYTSANQKGQGDNILFVVTQWQP